MWVHQCPLFFILTGLVLRGAANNRLICRYNTGMYVCTLQIAKLFGPYSKIMIALVLLCKLRCGCADARRKSVNHFLKSDIIGRSGAIIVFFHLRCEEGMFGVT